MLEQALLLAFLAPAAPSAAPSVPAPPALVSEQDDPKAEYKKRRRAAEGDVEKLWKVVDWCEANGLNAERLSSLRAIVKLEPDDKKARELLGHIYYEGEWFSSERKLESHKKKVAAAKKREAEKLAKSKGWVKHEGEWVDPADLPFLALGLVRDEEGNWLTPEEVELQEKGWVRQDLEWISPDDIPKIDQGLWKCGEEWLSLADANAYHAELNHPWRIPSEKFVLYTTCTRELAQRALPELDHAYRDLERIFGVVPARKPHLLVTSSQDQYSSFAGGGGSRNATEVRGFSSFHGAFFAEAWFTETEYLGAGAAYWDTSTEAGDRFGRLFARHAAGLSFVEAIDPSSELLRRMREEEAQFSIEEFWDEKKIPAWLRYGAATYVERYFTDSFVGAGGDAKWAKAWSISNLSSRGGWDSMEKLIEFPLSLDDMETSSRLLLQSGLVVAFLLEAPPPAVKKAHDKVRSALQELRRDPEKGAKNLDKSLRGLEKALLSKEKELLAFAGL